MYYNYVLASAVLAWFLAQVIKTALHFALRKKFRVERLIGAGGMPSSHSSFVVAGLTAVSRERGVTSVEFAIMFIISAIVIYDALGVRYAAGQHAKAINKINKLINSLVNAEKPDIKFDEADKKELKELLGHTPSEVLAGILLGFLVAWAVPFH